MFDVLMINAKLSRRFTFGEEERFGITLYADISNILNRANVRWIDSNGRIGGELGDPGAYYEPRRVRIGIQGDF